MKFEDFNKKLKNLIVSATTVGVSIAANAKTEKIDASLSDTTTEKSASYNPSDTLEAKESPVPLYTTSKTKEGAITPTGFNNSFFNNEFGIKPGDIEKIAKKHGFRTGNVLEFQTDLFSYLQINHPEIVDYIIKKYGQTAAKTLLDGKLGVRTAEALSAFQKKDDESRPEVKIEQPNKKIETPRNNFETKGFDEGYVLFDKSPSMEAHKEQLKKYLLTATDQNIPMHIVGFTNKADTALEAKNLKEGAEIIKNMKVVNEVKELAIDVAIQTLKEKKNNKRSLVLIVTDEELQDVSKEKLETLERIEKEKNVEFAFLIMLNDKQYKLNLGGIEAAFDQKYKKMGRAEDIEQTKRGISNFNKEIKLSEQEITAGGKNSNYMKELKKRIKDLKDNVSTFENRLKAFDKMSLDNLADFAISDKPSIQYFDTQPDYSNKANTIGMPGADISKNR